MPKRKPSPVQVPDPEPAKESKVFNPAFNDPEFSAGADRLVEAIRQYHLQIEGKAVGKEVILPEAIAILENRL